MPDPNARRDKALESIARLLAENNKLLTKIEKNTRDRAVRFTNTPYLERSDNATDSSDGGDTQQGTGPYATGAATPDS